LHTPCWAGMPKKAFAKIATPRNLTLQTRSGRVICTAKKSP
jgi:hypothetical protein